MRINPEFSAAIQKRPEYQNLLERNRVIDLGKARPHPGFIEDIERMTTLQSGPRKGALRTASEINRRINNWSAGAAARSAQMDDNPLWLEKGGKGVRPHVFNHRKSNAPSILKAAQAVFSDPADRMAFSEEESFDLGRIRYLIFDPRRISDTTLANLGLESFIPEKGVSEAEKLRQRARAIPAIKKILMNLEPVGDEELEDSKFFRAMRVASGVNEGDIVGTRHVGGRKTLYRADLHDANLSLLHIEAGYNKEIKTLAGMRSMLKRFQRALKDRWKDIRDFPEEAAAIQEGLLDALEILEHVVDEDKIKLRERILDCTTLTDNRGRFNPWIKSQSINHALRALDRREKKIIRISGYLGKDRIVLAALQASQELPVAAFVSEVDTWHDQLRLTRAETELSTEARASLQRDLWGVYQEIQAVNAPEAQEFRSELLVRVNALRGFVSARANDELHAEFESLNRIPFPTVPEALQRAFSNLRRLTPSLTFVEVPERRRPKIIANLKATRENLEAIKYNPYRAFSRAATAEIDTAISELEVDSFGESRVAAEAFIRTYILSKMVVAHQGILGVYEMMTLAPDSTHPLTLLSHLQRIEDDLATRKLAPNYKIDDLNEAYIQLYGLIATMKSELEALAYEAEGEAKPQNTADEKEEAPSSIEDILRKVERLAPRLGEFVRSVRDEVDRTVSDRVESFTRSVRQRLKSILGVPTTNEASLEPEQTVVLRPRRVISLNTQRETYGLLKDRIRAFDFESLFQ